MARTNKYSSINFNHVVEKNLTAPSNSGKAKNSQTHHQTQLSSFTSYSSISAAANAKSHGRMLVLTRPSPKPISTPPVVSPTQPKQPQTDQLQPRSAPTSVTAPDQASPSDPASGQISLRPLGRTGPGVLIPSQEREKEASPVSASPKPNRFVPPHLRPGFAGREERPGPEVFRGREHSQKHFGSTGWYGEGGRPKSGGHEGLRRGGESDLGLVGRPRSNGSRPSSSGWYV